jgi:hypothetical protein
MHMYFIYLYRQICYLLSYVPIAIIYSGSEIISPKCHINSVYLWVYNQG